MPFQASVSGQIGFGVVGELFLDGPLRAQPARLDSADAANNVVGRAFSIVSGGTGSWTANGDAANPASLVAEAGGNGPFAGILANPKVYASQGTSVGGTLAATLTLPDGALGELVQETAGIIVALPALAAAGDSVYYLQSDGSLVTTGPGAAAPAGTVGPIGNVARYTSTGAGLAVMSMPHAPQTVTAA